MHSRRCNGCHAARVAGQPETPMRSERTGSVLRHRRSAHSGVRRRLLLAVELVVDVLTVGVCVTAGAVGLGTRSLGGLFAGGLGGLGL